MPFIPHSQTDIEQMLASIGIDDTETLFDEIPSSLRVKGGLGIPEGMNELQIREKMQSFSEQDRGVLCFAGGGAYDHHIPSAVWQLATRGEFYTAYTPYQAEASQGSLQIIYEYQTMMCRLLEMDISNASMYDGATALAEAVLMAIRSNRKIKTRKILVPANLNPAWRQVLDSIVTMQDFEIITLPLDFDSGCSDVSLLDEYSDQGIAAVVAIQPGFTGVIEPVDALVNWAHEQKAIAVAVVNPMAMMMLKPPGSWGEAGADITVGEGQPLGIPLSSGGPYFGFMACKKSLVRQMPGRIVGRTTDLDGKQGFTLTLQAREQHIRRAKATSNICTNQGLMVTAATIHMSVMGAAGLKSVSEASHRNMLLLNEKLVKAGIKPMFDGVFFNEAVYEMPESAMDVIASLASDKVLAGVSVSALQNVIPEDASDKDLTKGLLICCTEKRSAEQMDKLVALLAAL